MTHHKTRTGLAGALITLLALMIAGVAAPATATTTTATTTVTAWGDDSFGQNTLPAGLTDVTAIAASYGHDLALHKDGTVTGWGANEYGQSTVPAGLTDVTAIAAGDYHSLALRADGTVVAWGANSAGQATVPTGLSDVTAIAAGGFHSLALRADGTVTAWGWNAFGEATVPAGLTGVTAIAAGSEHNLALSGSVGPTWTVDGFLGPVSNDADNTVNTVKAGATVPLQFRVYDGATELTDPAVIASFTATPIACESGTVLAEEVEFTTTGATSLRYTDGKFQQNWQTPKTTGCYKVTVTTTDGAALSADFQLH